MKLKICIVKKNVKLSVTQCSFGSRILKAIFSHWLEVLRVFISMEGSVEEKM